jgi:CheY-like chemotaxis protein
MPKDAPAILVVEDDEDVRETISEMLKGSGFQVEIAITGLEALAIIDKRPFDLMVADIALPGGLSGLEMTQCALVPAIRRSNACLFPVSVRRSFVIPSSMISWLSLSRPLS